MQSSVSTKHCAFFRAPGIHVDECGPPRPSRIERAERSRTGDAGSLKCDTGVTGRDGFRRLGIGVPMHAPASRIRSTLAQVGLLLRFLPVPLSSSSCVHFPSPSSPPRPGPAPPATSMSTLAAIFRTQSSSSQVTESSPQSRPATSPSPRHRVDRPTPWRSSSGLHPCLGQVYRSRHSGSRPWCRLTRRIVRCSPRYRSLARFAHYSRRERGSSWLRER